MAITVSNMGWAGKKNGELLALMNQDGLVLVADSADIVDLVQLMPSACTALSSIKPGEIVEVTYERRR